MLNIVLIGCGRIGKRHAEIISRSGRLLAVCDIVREKADAFAGEFNAAAFYTPEDLFASCKEIDLAVIATPNGLHASHSILALQSGCHVLCEKPMAISSADCKQMMAAAEKSGKQLIIVKQNRFNPPVAALKEVIDAGRLGKIFNVSLNCFWNRDAAYYSDSWKGKADMDGGILFTQFSHFIDLLYWLVGDVVAVHSFTSNYLHKGIIEFEDSGVAILEFANGAMGTVNFTINSFQKNMEGSLTVFGEKGTVKVGGQYLNELEYQCIEGYEIPALPKGNPANDYGHYSGSMSNHEKVYEHLLASLDNKASLSAQAAEGLKTVEIIEKIYKSSRNV